MPEMTQTEREADRIQREAENNKQREECAASAAYWSEESRKLNAATPPTLSVDERRELLANMQSAKSAGKAGRKPARKPAAERVESAESIESTESAKRDKNRDIVT